MPWLGVSWDKKGYVPANHAVQDHPWDSRYTGKWLLNSCIYKNMPSSLPEILIVSYFQWLLQAKFVSEGSVSTEFTASKCCWGSRLGTCILQTGAVDLINILWGPAKWKYTVMISLSCAGWSFVGRLAAMVARLVWVEGQNGIWPKLFCYFFLSVKYLSYFCSLYLLIRTTAAL